MQTSILGDNYQNPQAYLNVLLGDFLSVVGQVVIFSGQCLIC